MQYFSLSRDAFEIQLVLRRSYIAARQGPAEICGTQQEIVVLIFDQNSVGFLCEQSVGLRDRKVPFTGDEVATHHTFDRGSTQGKTHGIAM